MTHKRIGIALVTIAMAAACSHPQVQTANGEISTPARPATARALPVGTLMDARLNQQLGTQSSHVGDTFSATVTNAVIARTGRTTVPAGAMIWGHVTGVTPATNAPTQTAALVLDFDSLTFNGEQYPFSARITATNLQTRGGATTGNVVKSAAVGAVAVAGTAISLGRSSENGVLPSGSELSVQTTQSVALR